LEMIDGTKIDLVACAFLFNAFSVRFLSNITSRVWFAVGER